MKYVGQTSTLPITCTSFPADAAQMAALAEAFGESHNQHYGYRSDQEPLQFVALRVIGRGRSPQARVPQRVARAQEWIVPRGERKAYFGPGVGWLTATVMPRRDLAKGTADGPLIVDEYDTSIVVRPGWHARLDSWNSVVVERT